MSDGSEAVGLMQILGYTGDALIVLDRTFRLTQVNEHAVRLLGRSSADLIGRTPWECSPDTIGGQLEHTCLQVLKDGAPHSLEVHHPASKKWFRAHVFPTGDGLAVQCTDISAHKEHEAMLLHILEELHGQMRTRTAELTSALRKTQALVEDRSRFLAMAAHELRTPLTTVLSSLALMERYRTANDPSKEEHHRLRIYTMVTRMMDLLNDMIYLEYAEQTGDRSDPERIDLHEFFTEVVSGLDGIQKPGQYIVLEHNGGTEVRQDRKMLKMVMQNLLNNAIKYSDDTIQVHTKVQDDEAVIEVIDAGIGIPSEDRKHLFERFFRASNARELPGTGLGLSIAKRYTDRMHGTIDVASVQGEGSTFTVRVPLETGTT